MKKIKSMPRRCLRYLGDESIPLVFALFFRWKRVHGIRTMPLCGDHSVTHIRKTAAKGALFGLLP